MSKTFFVSRQVVRRMVGRFILAGVLAAFVSACAKPYPEIPTSSPPTATETQSLPSPTPTETPVPPPTETATPAFSIFGRWALDPGTTTVLVNQPPAGQMCFPDASFWVPEIIIEPTADPAVVIVKGLHEHVQSQQLPFDIANRRIEDTFVMVDINQSVFLILQLTSDGRLYHEEQDLAGGMVYCSASVYYTRAGE